MLRWFLNPMQYRRCQSHPFDYSPNDRTIDFTREGKSWVPQFVKVRQSLYHYHMPDRRKHRGPAPQDAELFAPDGIQPLRSAVAELSWLLSRGYAPASSLKLVGDRHSLTVRQRTAVARSACSDEALAGRLARLRPVNDLAGKVVTIDGYNLLITLESALGSGVVLGGRDSTYRDLASLHGSYRAIAETEAALALAGEVLADLGFAGARWLLDAPVSNSGRLKARMASLAAARGWAWTIDLARNVDAELIASPHLIVSSDSAVLDACGRWLNLARFAIETRVPSAWVVDLGVG